MAALPCPLSEEWSESDFVVPGFSGGGKALPPSVKFSFASAETKALSFSMLKKALEMDAQTMNPTVLSPSLKLQIWDYEHPCTVTVICWSNFLLAGTAQFPLGWQHPWPGQGVWCEPGRGAFAKGQDAAGCCSPSNCVLSEANTQCLGAFSRQEVCVTALALER